MSDIVEVKIGYDGIVVANSRAAPAISISLKSLYLALAKDIPDDDGGWMANPNKLWSDVDAKLHKHKIVVLGPPPTSGTRDAFAELALEGGCKQFALNGALKKTDKSLYKARCHTIREDGAYVEAGENDNLIVQKIKANASAFGVFGYSFLEQNSGDLRGSSINGIEPTFEAIADGSYPISRPLYFYVKKAHVGKVPGLLEYMETFIGDEASGDDGYLSDSGLIPLPPRELAELQKTVKALTVLSAKL